MFRAHQLYLLQQIDLRLENLEREFQELDDGSDLEKRLRYHEERIAEMREKLRSTRRDVADRELALRGIEEKLEKLRAIARSGVIRNPREVVRMEQELKELDRQRDELETLILEAFEELDRMEAELDESEAELNSLRDKLHELQQLYHLAVEQMTAERERLLQKREELIQQIDPELLERYERIRERKGIAVTTVDGDLCGACRVSLTAGAKRLLHDPDAIPICENCGRIICLPPEQWDIDEEESDGGAPEPPVAGSEV